MVLSNQRFQTLDRAFVVTKRTFDRQPVHTMEKFDSFYGTVPVQSPGGRGSGYGHGPGRQPDTAQITEMSPGRLELDLYVRSEGRNYTGKFTCRLLQTGINKLTARSFSLSVPWRQTLQDQLQLCLTLHPYF